MIYMLAKGRLNCSEERKYRGFPFLLTHNEEGFRQAYALVPPDHPWAGLVTRDGADVPDIAGRELTYACVDFTRDLVDSQAGVWVGAHFQESFDEPDPGILDPEIDREDLAAIYDTNHNVWSLDDVRTWVQILIDKAIAAKDDCDHKPYPRHTIPSTFPRKDGYTEIVLNASN